MPYFKLIEESGLYKNSEGKIYNLLEAEIVSEEWEYFEDTEKAVANYEITPLEQNNTEMCLSVTYPYPTRGIFVYIPDSSITKIAMSPELRPLMEYCFHLPNKKTECGLIMWFEDFVNPLMSPTATESLLVSLGSIVMRR